MPKWILNSSPYLAALVAVLFWAGNFTVARFAGFEKDLPPVFMAFSRWVLAFLLISPWAVSRMRRDWGHICRTPITIFLCALSGVAMFAAFTYIAAETTFSINLSIIAMASPLFTAIVASVLMRELPSIRTISGLLICVVGVAVVILASGVDGLIAFRTGDLWMLAAALAWGVYTALVPRVDKNVSGLALLGTTIFGGMLILFPFVVSELNSGRNVELSLSAVAVVVYLGVFVSLVGYLLWNYAARQLGPIKTGAIYFLIPFFTALISSIFLSENVHTSQILGFFVILFGISLVREARLVQQFQRGIQTITMFVRRVFKVQ